MDAKPKKRVIRRMVTIVATTYFAVGLLLFLFQRSVLYHPTAIPDSPPGTLKSYEVDGATLNVSVRLKDGPNALIYFGGNGEDVAGSLSIFSLYFPDHAIYMIHYRGYGGSTGSPTEETLLADAEFMYAKIHGDHEKVTVVGRSLGTGVAVHVASKNDVDRLVLVTPYDSILNVAKSQFPFFPIRFMLKDKFESWRKADSVRSPTTFIVAENDEVIASERTTSLFSHFAPGIAKMIVIKDVGHNTISTKPEYMGAVVNGD